MATLIIKGDVKQLEIIKKKSRSIALRHDLTISITDENPKKKEPKTDSDTDTEIHWKTAVANIKAATSLDELEPFKDDDRDSVKKALKDKTLELTQ